jgi:hypothetical protein
MANFEGTYAHLGNKVDHHVMQQRLGELLRSFIQRFSLV